jgi:hypothetical protein
MTQGEQGNGDQHLPFRGGNRESKGSEQQANPAAEEKRDRDDQEHNSNGIRELRPCREASVDTGRRINRLAARGGAPGGGIRCVQARGFGRRGAWFKHRRDSLSLTAKKRFITVYSRTVAH